MSSTSDKKPNILAQKKLPDSPGVYFFLGVEGEILYIGKATSLRDRVRSYFAQDLMVTRGPKLQLMIERATDIKWRTTDSVLEALLLESYLIKKHQPPYNTDEKDDKSYNYVVITKEKFPRVLLMRGKDLEEISRRPSFGTSHRPSEAMASREAFPLFHKSEKTVPGKSSSVPKEGYRPISSKYIFGPFPQGGMLREAMKIVRRIFPFRDTCLPFETQENARDAGKPERELSSSPVFSKENNKVKKKVALSGFRKPYPCFNHQIGLCPGVCVGKVTKEEYAKTIRNIKMFFEGKKKRLVTQLEKEMKEAAKRLEFEKANELKKTLFALGHIHDVSLLKKDFLNDKINGTDSISASPRATFRIEAYDAAHLAGKDVVGVMTVVEDGVPNKAEYRQFKIRGGDGNDLASLEQMLTRRLAHREWRLPSLIVVDGFDLQIDTARKVLDSLGLDIPIVSVVKDERHKPKDILGDTEYSSKHREAILLANSEAHRFAITFHRKRRNKSFIQPKRIGF